MATSVGPAVPVRVRCPCKAKRTLPFWWLAEALVEIRRVLDGRIPSDRPVASYHCKECDTVLLLTAEDLYLTRSD